MSHCVELGSPYNEALTHPYLNHHPRKLLSRSIFSRVDRARTFA